MGTCVSRKGARFLIAQRYWTDTTTPHGRLMLTGLGGLAKFERELIRERTHEGRERAVVRGATFGRTAEAHTAPTTRVIKRSDAGEATREIAHFISARP